MATMFQYENHPDKVPEEQREFYNYRKEQKRRGYPPRLKWFFDEVIDSYLSEKLMWPVAFMIYESAAIRKPAFGMTSSQLDRLERDMRAECSEVPSEIHKRFLYEETQSFMLQDFTSTDGSSEDPMDLVEILKSEYTTGVPSPVPALCFCNNARCFFGLFPGDIGEVASFPQAPGQGITLLW